MEHSAATFRLTEYKNHMYKVFGYVLILLLFLQMAATFGVVYGPCMQRRSDPRACLRQGPQRARRGQAAVSGCVRL